MEWRPVVGYEEDYEIRQGEDGGALRRLRRRHKSPKGRIMKACRDGLGYPRAVLTNDQGVRLVRLHILILEAFVGPRPPRHEACHADDNKLNNTIPNLYWGTRSENLRDAYRNGRLNKKKYRRGLAHHNAKLSEADKKEIRRMRKKGALLKTIANKFNISETHASRVGRHI